MRTAIHFDSVSTALLLAALVPAFRLARVPLHLTVGSDFQMLLTMLLTVSTATAILYALVASPSGVWRSVMARRTAFNWKRIGDVTIPPLYFFIGFSLMAAFNVAIAAKRYDGSYDPILNRMDAWILFGRTVPGFVAWAIAHLSPRWFSAAEIVYAALFPQVGAMILFLGVKRGRRVAMRFVGAVLAAYYISLIVFFFIPAGGPAMLTPQLSQSFPALGVTYYQRFVAEQYAALLAHRMSAVASASYLIACPSMHMAQAILLAWAARPWRRLQIALAVYAALLVPAILLLEQHYVVDLIGGAAAAAIAVAVAKCR